MKTKLLLLSLCIVLFGCKRNEGFNYQTESAEAGMEPMEMDGNEQRRYDSPTPVERKVIKTGVLEFETNDLVKSKSEIQKALKENKGYIVNDRESNNTYRKSNYLKLRVPSQNFDKLLSGIASGVDHFDKKEINAKDVTEEFLDVEARLITKKKLEARYQEILVKANTVTEILEIERQINNVRGEIESIEGRLNYLKSQISFSTLEVTFYKSISGK